MSNWVRYFPAQKFCSSNSQSQKETASQQAHCSTERPNPCKKQELDGDGAGVMRGKGHGVWAASQQAPFCPERIGQEGLLDLLPSVALLRLSKQASYLPGHPVAPEES